MVASSWVWQKDEGLHLSDIRFAIGETALRDMGLFNAANNQGMASQIQAMHHFALQINRALLNHRRRI